MDTIKKEHRWVRNYSYYGTRTWKIPQSTNVAKNIQKSKLSVGVHALRCQHNYFTITKIATSLHPLQTAIFRSQPFMWCNDVDFTRAFIMCFIWCTVLEKLLCIRES